MLILGTEGLDNLVMQEVLKQADEKRLKDLQHMMDYLAGKVVEQLAKAMNRG